MIIENKNENYQEIFKLAKQQKAIDFLDYNSNVLFLRYILPKLVQCKQLGIPISISFFANREVFYKPPQLTVYKKALYSIDISQFESSSTESLWCNLEELAIFLMEHGLKTEFIETTKTNVKIKVTKQMEKKENQVLCKK